MGVKPIIATKTVTTAGTQVQLSTADLFVTSIYFEALRTNTGIIYVGDSDCSSTLYMASLGAGQGFNLSQGADVHGSGSLINVKHIWVDSSVNGEKVQWTYIQKSGSV